MKKDIGGCHLRSDKEVVTAVEEWVKGKDPDFFSSGLMALELRWSKCITLEGNYRKKRNPGRDISLPIFIRKEIETRKLERKSKQQIYRLNDLLYRLNDIISR